LTNGKEIELDREELKKREREEREREREEKRKRRIEEEFRFVLTLRRIHSLLLTFFSIYNDLVIERYDGNRSKKKEQDDVQKENNMKAIVCNRE
jgi:hypothetical protein